MYLSEDFEAGIGPLWQERGFPSIQRRNRFSLGTDPNGNHYLKVESADLSRQEGNDVTALAVVSPAPTFPHDVLAGRLFGALPGALLAVTGATVDASASFLLARWLGRDFVARFAVGHVDFCRECSDELLTKVVVLARLIPAVSFDVVSQGAALTKMSLGGFAAASFLGMIPLTLVYTSVGPLVAVGSAVSWTAGGVAVALLLLLPRWIERYDAFGLARHFRHGGEEDAA